MKSDIELSMLINDFVIGDRRIGDCSSVGVSVHVVGDGLLRLAARSGTVTDPRFLGLRGGPGWDSIEQSIAFGANSAALLRHTREGGIQSVIDCVIRAGDERLGLLSLESDADLGPHRHRIQVLAALVAYELFHLQRRLRTPSELSRDLGRVLRSAREEINLTQADLAATSGTSRVALSSWEAGAQPPTRGPARRWAAALGLLAGGRSPLITAVDATPQLLEMLKREPKRLAELSPDQFELLVGERLERMGYDIQRTGNANQKDGGIDIIAVPRASNVASFLLAVQVKHHRDPHKTGREAVDRLLAWQGTTFRLGMLVTNTSFTQDAIWAASRNSAKDFLRLRDFQDLTRWLHGIFSSEADWREIPDFVELAPGVTIRVPKPRFAAAGVVWPEGTVRLKA